MTRYKFKSIFVGNTDDELHCSQACYAMAVARLTGKQMTAVEAEGPTGFRKGWLTWPFAMIDSLSKLGLYVKTIDASDPKEFAANPAKTIEMMSPGDEENINRMIKDSDLDKEVAHIRSFLDSSFVSHEKRAPNWDDLKNYLDQQETVVIAWVNYRYLVGRTGSVGHFVIVDKIHDNGILVQDPGPPHRPNHLYPTEVFRKAWQWYGANHAELLIISSKPIS